VLNAVWARTAETMTRELVGSSEGAPNTPSWRAAARDSLEFG
jgi:hypothetical protein